MRRIMLFLCLALPSCGGLVDFGPKGPPAELYRLEALPRAQEQPADVPRIIVEQPQVAGALDSSRVAVRRGAQHVEYLANVQWVERTPRLIQRHLTESLDNSGKLAAISGFNIDEQVDYRLRVDVRDFHAVVSPDGGAPTIEISWSARLLKAAPPDVVAAKHFSASEMASANKADAILEAFNEAMNTVVRDLVEWAAQSTERSAGAAGAQP